MEEFPKPNNQQELKPYNQDSKDFEFVEPQSPEEEAIQNNGYKKIKDKRTGLTSWCEPTPEYEAYMADTTPGKPIFQGVKYAAMNGEFTVGGSEEMDKIREEEEIEREKQARLGELANKIAENTEETEENTENYSESTMQHLDDWYNDETESNYAPMKNSNNPKNKEHRDKADNNPNLDHKQAMSTKNSDRFEILNYAAATQNEIDSRSMEGSFDRAITIAEHCMKKPNALQTYYTEGALDYIAAGTSPFKKPGVAFHGFETLERNKINNVARRTAKDVWAKIKEDKIVPTEIDNPEQEREFYDKAYVVATTIGAERVQKGHLGGDEIKYSLPVVQKGAEFVDEQLSQHGIEYDFDQENPEHDEEIYDTFEIGFVGVIDALKSENITDENSDKLFKVAEFYFNHLLQSRNLDDASLKTLTDDIARRAEDRENSDQFKTEEIDKLKTELSQTVDEISDNVLEEYNVAENPDFKRTFSSFIDWYNASHAVVNKQKSKLSKEDKVDISIISQSDEFKALIDDIRNGRDKRDISARYLDFRPHLYTKNPHHKNSPNASGHGILKELAQEYGLNKLKQIPNVQVLGTIETKPEKPIYGEKKAGTKKIVTDEGKYVDTKQQVYRGFEITSQKLDFDQSTGKYINPMTGKEVPSKQVRHFTITPLAIKGDNNEENAIFIAECISDRSSSAFILEVGLDLSSDGIFLIGGWPCRVLEKFHHKKSTKPGIDEDGNPIKRTLEQKDCNRVWDRIAKYVEKLAS